MDTHSGTLHTIVRHLVLALQPLKDAVADLPGFRTLLYQMAWEVKSLPPEYPALATKVDAALAALDGLGDDPPPARVLDVLEKVKALYTGLQSMNSAPEGVDPEVFLAEIGRSLFDLLLVNYLVEAFPGLHATLLALGIISEEFSKETATRPGVLISRVRWEEIPKVLTGPDTIFQRVYGWGTNEVDFHRLAGHLLEFFVALDWPAYIGRVDRELGRGFMDAPDLLTTPIEWELKMPALVDNIGGKEIEVGLALLELPPQGSKPAGLILQPLVPTEIGTAFDLSDTLKLELRAGSDVSTTLGVLLRPGDISVKFPLQAGAALPQAGFGMTLRYSPPGPILLLGTPGKSRLEVIGLATHFNLDLRDGQLELQLEAEPESLRLVISTADTDGFLAQILGDREVAAQLPLMVRWSNRTGFGFVGGTGFQVSLPCNLRAGQVTLQQIQLSLSTSRDASGDAPDLALEAGVSLNGRIGPVSLSVDNIGLGLDSRFTAGNAGPFDIALGFKPPGGLGIAIDGPGIAGGGFLRFDPKKGEYSGVLDLQIKDTIAVKAVGLLVTHMPNGAKGYSLLIIITEEGFEPIPLPLGFKLTGIGGLLALNRTFDEDALRAGLKNHMLESVMFPKDPVRNAPQILSNLNKIFPPSDGQHLFGPMARIAWGTPTLLTADLALVLEIGARLRLLILARIVAVLPKPENDLVHLEMDGVGVIDFDQGTAALDATLHDSRLLKKFVLTGDMAMRLKWDNAPNFALAVGGLHPAFNPPPAFPKLERIALNLAAGNNPRLRCEAYFALTANTVQFGARAELYAAAAGFSIQGDMGFDVLIQFAPFFFIADFYAQVQLKRGSTNLFKVKVEGALSGPRPLHIKGRASFSILWWDISIRIDKTLVGGEKPPLPEPIDVLPLLKEALADAANWKGQLPDARRPMVTLRAGPRAAAEVLLHPLGTLSVKQNIVPLDMEISRFGQAAPSGVRRFAISSVNLGGEKQSTQSVKDFFAPAQFFEMSDNEKLSRPSFEPMTAGVTIGSNEILFTADAEDWLEVGAIEFETIVVDKQKGSTQPGDQVNHHNPYRLSAELLALQARFGAAAKSDLRRTGKARYRTVVGKNKVVKEGWSVVATDNLKVAPVPGIEEEKPTNYSEAVQALHKLKQEDPAKAAGLKILRLSELI